MKFRDAALTSFVGNLRRFLHLNRARMVSAHSQCLLGIALNMGHELRTPPGASLRATSPSGNSVLKLKQGRQALVVAPSTLWRRTLC